MTIFFTSDPHYYHANVIQYCDRPYKSVEEMNEALVRNWNAVVGPEDTVYCMGDFSLAFRPVELFSTRLMGNKILVPGNHDWCHPSHKKSRGQRLQEQTMRYADHGWTVLPIFSSIEIDTIGTVNLCHMPYKGDSTDQRHQDYRLVDDGKPLICGHIHEKWLKKGRMLNVGVDRHNYTPITMDRVIELLQTPGDIP